MLDEKSLRNRFFLLRHGRSLANQQQRIVSMPPSGLEQFGLTEAGVRDVRSTVISHRDELASVDRIFASDFLRTRQTAEIVAEILAVEVELEPKLRERRFGDFEGQSSDHYATVWDQDQIDYRHTRWNVESVSAVESRMSDFLTTLDRGNDGKTFLLVSHGDPLQILIQSARGGGFHRDQTPMETADLRSIG